MRQENPKQATTIEAMSKKRTNYSAEFKARVISELFRGEASYDDHVTLVLAADRTAHRSGIFREQHEQHLVCEYYQRLPDWHYHDPDDLELLRGCQEI